MRAQGASQRVKRLVDRPPLLILQAVLQRIPFHPIQIAHFEVLRFEAMARQHAVCDNSDNLLREAMPCDIEGLVRCLDKRDVYARRFAAGDSCIACIMEGRIIGYEWLCTHQYHIEEQSGYKLQIPDDSIYAYDAYVRPEDRRRGVWLRIQEHITRRLGQVGKKSIIAMIEYGNDVSRKTHLSYGYSPVQMVWYMRIFCFKFFKLIEIMSTASRNN